MSKISILLVEDDDSLGFLMSEYLTSKGYEVTLCKDGLNGLKAFGTQKFKFVILDVMLPGMDGFTIAKKIREKSSEIPVIFVTARSMKEDKIRGFNLGVDDYITKPFDEDELHCRIQAILNRIEIKQELKDHKIWIGKYLYDNHNQSLTFEGECRRLTKRENEVLYLLIENKDQIVKRETILNSIWGSNDYFSGRSMDVYISKLRKYLQGDPLVVIENIPKVGFLFSVSI